MIDSETVFNQTRQIVFWWICSLNQYSRDAGCIQQDCWNLSQTLLFLLKVKNQNIWENLNFLTAFSFTLFCSLKLCWEISLKIWKIFQGFLSLVSSEDSRVDCHVTCARCQLKNIIPCLLLSLSLLATGAWKCIYF